MKELKRTDYVEIHKVLNALEAAEFLGAHVETVRRMARRGDIPSFKVGKDWRFQRDALTRWIETHNLRRDSPNILVIDDEKSIRDLIRRILKEDGYKVYTAQNGEEALETVSKVTIQAVLLDLMMPMMSGPEFLKLLRKTDMDLPVIIITGYPDGDLMDQAMKFGPIILLAKPIDITQLKSSVKIALGQKAIEGQRI